MRASIVALLSVLVATAAVAQDKIYKVRMPDGGILFTDRPPPGATIVGEREVPPPPASAPAAPVRQASPSRSLKQRAEEADENARPQASRFDQAYAAVQTAEEELAQARRQLAEGRAPLPGEMVGTARGGVRPAPAYQDRIAGMERAVAEAEERLARARSELNASR